MANSLDLTALATNVGGYCREFKEKIFADMLLGLEERLAAAGITVLDNIQDEEVLTNMVIGDMIRPGKDDAFAPTEGAIAMDGRILKARDFKADIMIYPLRLQKIWAAKMRNKKGAFKNLEDIPFHQFLVDEIVKKIKSELHKATYKAVYDANGDNWADICNGFLKLITDDIADSNIATVTTGAITSANVVSAVEAVAFGLGDAYKANPGFVQMSSTLYQWYITATEANVGRSMHFTELSQGKLFVRGTQIELINNPDLGASQRIFAYGADNLFVGTDTLADINNFDVQRYDRSLKILVDGKWGVNYALANTTNKPISANEQE